MTSRKSALRKAEEGHRADQALLTARLEGLGLRGVRELALHQNRTVMVSFSNGVLRVHRGYAYAPDSVLQAIVRFLTPRVRKADRLRAEQVLLGFPVDRYMPGGRPAPRRRPRRPGDRRTLAELRGLHRELNARHFGGRLSEIPFRLSGRMRSRLGDVLLEEGTNRPVEIGLSRQHLERDAWNEVSHTVLHEMVHQWQAETGLDVDHGPAFRRKARDVGIEPAARRDVQARPAVAYDLWMTEE